MRRTLIALLLVSSLMLAVCAAGCGQNKDGGTVLLESEKRLEGMYEECQTIDLVDGSLQETIKVDELPDYRKEEVTALLKRSNGMTKEGTWAGAVLSAVLADKGVAKPYRELKIEAWDGYVGRLGYDIAEMPDTIFAYIQDGEPVPKVDGPVRLVVASQDGFYWVRMVTRIEVLR